MHLSLLCFVWIVPTQHVFTTKKHTICNPAWVAWNNLAAYHSPHHPQFRATVAVGGAKTASPAVAQITWSILHCETSASSMVKHVIPVIWKFSVGLAIGVSCFIFSCSFSNDPFFRGFSGGSSYLSVPRTPDPSRSSRIDGQKSLSQTYLEAYLCKVSFSCRNLEISLLVIRLLASWLAIWSHVFLLVKLIPIFTRSKLQNLSPLWE